jgi:hypothetical protein
MTYYKLLILIISTCKYVTSSDDMSCFSLKNISKNPRSMSNHFFFIEKIILKIQENHIMPHHLSPLKNNYENSSSIPNHLSLLKNNSKNSRKSLHTTSPFFIENQF